MYRYTVFISRIIDPEKEIVTDRDNSILTSECVPLIRYLLIPLEEEKTAAPLNRRGLARRQQAICSLNLDQGGAASAHAAACSSRGPWLGAKHPHTPSTGTRSSSSFWG